MSSADVRIEIISDRVVLVGLVSPLVSSLSENIARYDSQRGSQCSFSIFRVCPLPKGMDCSVLVPGTSLIRRDSCFHWRMAVAGGSLARS